MAAFRVRFTKSMAAVRVRFSAVLALVVLSFPRAEAFGSTPDRSTRTPFTFDVSGGGFRTMTAGMAFSRALSEAFEEVGGSWDDVTHLSGNSGGQWFATQFAFGQEWFDDLTRSRLVLGYKSLGVILGEWAYGYAQNVRAIIMPPFEPAECIVDLGFVQFDVSDFFKEIVDTLTAMDFPVVDWELYTSAMVRATVPMIDTLTYDAPRPGMPNAALLQMMTVPAGVWSNASYPVHRPASFDSQGAPMHLPLYHRAPAATSALVETSPGFFFPATSGSNAELGFSAGYGPDSSNDQMVFMDFTPPGETRVAEVMAISSAAVAFIASPPIIEIFVREVNPDITAEGMQLVLECMPFDLQSLAPPLTMQVVQDPSGSPEPPQPWAPTYRGFDGGYTDNSAILNAISAMIADCEAGDASLSCAAKTFDMIAINDGGQPGPDQTGVGCFFNHTGCPPVGGTFVSEVGVQVPSQRIFQENYPSEDQWIRYLSGAAGEVGDGPVFNFTDLSEEIREAAIAAEAGIIGSGLPGFRPPVYNSTPTEFGTLLGQSVGLFHTSYAGSRVMAGSFQTMDNGAWSIKAGYTINLLLFELDYPEATDPLIWPADFAVFAFLFFYAPLNEAQQKGALPYLKQWLVNKTISPI